jgi:hypothetical protein
MRLALSLTVIALSGAAVVLASRSTAEPDASEQKEPIRKDSGLEKRELWTTSKVKGSPEPPAPYTMTRVYPKLKFFEALDIVAVPGKKAWVVAERPGKVYYFDADPAKAEPIVILDVKHTVYGVVLHPKFRENGYLYLAEVPDGAKETPDGTRLVRYTVDREKMTADPATAKLIFTWPNGGHNGG